MANKYLSFLKFKGSLLEIKDKFARNAIGVLESLKTTNKSSIVNALNEVFDKVGTADIDKTLKLPDKAADSATVGSYFSSLTLGKGEDGLVYIFLNSQPIGTGLELSNATVPAVESTNDGTTFSLKDTNNVVQSSVTDGVYTAYDPTNTVTSHISNGVVIVS